MSKQQIYLTGNTYFGRSKALTLRKRKQYKDLEDMNLSMVDKWNAVVGIDDLVYHFGYFAHDPYITNEMLELLNGNIYFLNNGTDQSIIDAVPLYENIMMYEGQTVELAEKNSILSYYPYEVWDNKDTYHFYADTRIKTDLNKTAKRMNVSFDVWNCPINIDECIEFINSFEEHKKITK